MYQFFKTGLKFKSQAVLGISSCRGLSYKHIGGSEPLLYKTVGEILDDAAERFGDKTAVLSVYQNEKISFINLKKKAEKFASGLLEFGISPGDRVGLWSPNSLEWCITSFALAKAGVISVYLNPAYQALEMKHCLETVGVKMLIAAESFKGQSYAEILHEIDPKMVQSESGEVKSSILPKLKSIVSLSSAGVSGMIPFEAISDRSTETSMEKLNRINKTFNPDDSSNIQFTSGTTGSPKGAVLSHFNIVNNSYFVMKRQGLHLKEHKMCFMGPLFHAMGSVIALLGCVHTGITLILPDVSFSPSKAAEAIIKEKCTILLGTPTMYIDVLKIITEKNLKATTPEIAVSGGAYASTTLFADMFEKLNVKRVASVYGLTETGPVVFMSQTHDDRDKQLSTVGYVLEHMETKVVDENGLTVPWETPGELWVRGYNIMKGYWDDEKKTKDAVTPENWFRTGDQFSISKDGYGKIVGRIKDMIIRGGENIYPAEVEEFLSSHPDILESQVVGVPDKRLGEQVCACIRLKQDSIVSEEEIKKFCQGKIANFKIPQYVWFVKEYPRTSSGKVQKNKLKTQAINHLNIQEN